MGGFQEQCEALLMHLAETDFADRDVTGFLDGLGVATPGQHDMVDYLAKSGLVENIRSLGAADCRLTGEGRAAADALIRQRPVRRVAELQARMLRWVDQDDDVADWSGFCASDQVVCLGHRFTARDVEHQAEFLYDAGLIRAVPSWGVAKGTLRPELTANGRDCLLHGGDVAAYLGTRGQTTTTTYNNTTSRDTHIGTVNNSQLAVNSSHFSQTQNNEVAPGYEDLAAAVRRLLTQLPAHAELTDEAREEIQEAAEETLETITAADPKPRKVRRMVDGIVGALSRAATALGQQALEGAGVATHQWTEEHTQLLLNALPM
ncbi:hypothetical protein [Actinokineospora bangkokensis]|uniref:Uncharacterized protein n=1 Tax=Actinokineospora bangkokensis TaxID=1193682 RepID=A0A1Q9LKL5_9PSEU|nr:hypothetical protein [Actinokineospora bangkokensis]OLR92597.1 hypothetical protein BJP25_21340 [Actinokineospora bangkokensis]